MTIAVAVVLSLIAIQQAAPTNTARPVITTFDAPAPPETFEMLWDAVDVVARVHVRAADTVLRGSRSDSPGFPVTEYSVLVQEVFKGTLNSGSTVTVMVPIGTARAQDGTLLQSYASGRRALDLGEELVLFLKRTRLGPLEIAFGEVGHYPLDRASVSIPLPARQWSIFGGARSLTPTELIAALRQFRDKPGK